MTEAEVKEKYNLKEQDIEEVKQRGISIDTLAKQIDQLKQGTSFVKLYSPCTINDGIKKVDDKEFQNLTELFEERNISTDTTKFIPASGAASRMFKKLEQFMSSNENLENAEEEVKQFFEKIERFAFYPELKKLVAEKEDHIDKLLSTNRQKEILRILLTEAGMNYSSEPKALIPFHTYGEEHATAFEEQVYEAKEYLLNEKKRVKLHFTISPEAEKSFIREKGKVINEYAGKSIEPEITFSFQKKSTDTVALDKDGNLFRDGDKILFRPGGHGALIENLNDLDADFAFIKNIDNVQKRENLSLVISNKKMIGGMLLQVQERVHSYLKKLEENSSGKLINEIQAFLIDTLYMKLDLEKFSSVEEKKERFSHLLNRPIRVCGVVLNEGHPGGGPFWVEDTNGRITRQIIEEAQVNMSDEEQKRIFESSTHFNPVDIACSLKDFQGNKFNLTNYIDESMVFVADKSKGGKELTALELPGLWNGAMADWITIFVEVPKETFTPVKEVNDLLKDYHQ